MNALNVMKRFGLFDYDVTTVKQLGHYHKIANMRCCRHPGLVAPVVKKGSKRDFKTDENISRARSCIKEYVLCNPWNYFCTFTISPDRFDRYNFKPFYSAFSRFVRNYNRFCTDDELVKYLIIPEMHKDGAWHMHGFIKGIKEKDLQVNEFGYLTWKQYNDKFGYISFDRVRDVDKCASYIMKYITKEVSNTVSKLGAHTYYASKGLNRAELLYKGKARLVNTEWDHVLESGFCRLKTIDTRIHNTSDFLEVCREY